MTEPEPLIMPADEFAAVEAVAAHLWTPEDLLDFKERLREAAKNTVYLAALPSDGWRERAEAAEAKLAAIAEHCRLRINGPGRSGMSMAAAGLILGMAEGSNEKENHG